MTINFVVGGMLGDFFHTLFAVKQICLKRNDKAIIYMAEGLHEGDKFTFGLEKTFHELYPIVSSQSYVSEFHMKPIHVPDPHINLTTWRTPPNGFIKSWTNMLCSCYSFHMSGEYKWIETPKINSDILGKVLIHKSDKRHNADFDMGKYINNIQDEMLFITSSQHEWDIFPYKDKAKLYFVNSIEEMTVAINSCKYFIGNQSAPLAIASSLDVNRFAELDKWGGAIFYINEEKFSNKLSWFLSNDANYFTPDAIKYEK